MGLTTVRNLHSTIMPKIALLRPLILLSLSALAQNGKSTDDRPFHPRVHGAHPFVLASWQSASRLSLPLHPRAQWGATYTRTHPENLVVTKRLPPRETRSRNGTGHTAISRSVRDLTGLSLWSSSKGPVTCKPPDGIAELIPRQHRPPHALPGMGSKNYLQPPAAVRVTASPH